MIYADSFSQILDVLSKNTELRARVLILAQTKPFHCKTIEEKERGEIFREILVKLMNGEFTISVAYGEIERKLSRAFSKYAAEPNVFPDKWEEKILNFQLSRFYNYAVLQMLIEKGVDGCFIPEIKLNENCDCKLKTNQMYKTEELLGDMVKFIDLGCESAMMKVPEQPDCPHVVKPIEYMNAWKC